MHHGMGGMMCPTCGCGGGCGHDTGAFMKVMFMKMPWKIFMHADELGLSEEQVCTLRKRHAEARKQMIQIKSQIKMDMIDLEDALWREEIDMTAAEQKIREMGKLKGDMFIAMIQAMHDMRQAVTHEQRMKIKEMIMCWLKKSKGGGMAMEHGEEPEAGEESEE